MVRGQQDVEMATKRTPFKDLINVFGGNQRVGESDPDGSFGFGTGRYDKFGPSHIVLTELNGGFSSVQERIAAAKAKFVVTTSAEGQENEPIRRRESVGGNVKATVAATEERGWKQKFSEDVLSDGILTSDVRSKVAAISERALQQQADEEQVLAEEQERLAERTRLEAQRAAKEALAKATANKVVEQAVAQAQQEILDKQAAIEKETRRAEFEARREAQLAQERAIREANLEKRRVREEKEKKFEVEHPVHAKFLAGDDLEVFVAEYWGDVKEALFDQVRVGFSRPLTERQVTKAEEQGLQVYSRANGDKKLAINLSPLGCLLLNANGSPKSLADVETGISALEAIATTLLKEGDRTVLLEFAHSVAKIEARLKSKTTKSGERLFDDLRFGVVTRALIGTGDLLSPDVNFDFDQFSEEVLFRKENPLHALILDLQANKKMAVPLHTVLEKEWDMVKTEVIKKVEVGGEGSHPVRLSGIALMLLTSEGRPLSGRSMVTGKIAVDAILTKALEEGDFALVNTLCGSLAKIKSNINSQHPDFSLGLMAENLLVVFPIQDLEIDSLAAAVIEAITDQVTSTTDIDTLVDQVLPLLEALKKSGVDFTPVLERESLMDQFLDTVVLQTDHAAAVFEFVLPEFAEVINSYLDARRQAHAAEEYVRQSELDRLQEASEVDDLVSQVEDVLTGGNLDAVVHGGTREDIKYAEFGPEVANGIRDKRADVVASLFAADRENHQAGGIVSSDYQPDVFFADKHDLDVNDVATCVSHATTRAESKGTERGVAFLY